MFAKINYFEKIKHFFPVLPVYFIIVTVIFGYTFCYVLEGDFDIIKMLVSPIFYYCALMVVICHSYSMFTHPGEGCKISDINYKTQLSTNKEDSLYCNKCNSPRSERSHHCSKCKQCILKMDHHCPWVANCVGLYNQKYFYLFLFYATLGDFIAFICLAIKVFSNPNLLNTGKNYNSIGEIFYDLRWSLLNIFSAIFSLSMTIAIGILFILQTNMISCNSTTLEEKIYKNKKDSPWYNSDDKFNNFKLVLGDKFYDWFLPTYYINQAYNKRGQTKLADANYLSLTDSQEYDDIHIDLS